MTERRNGAFVYENQASGRLQRIRTGPVVSGEASSVAAACGDYDGDGFLDLAVANWDSLDNQLYRNGGNGNHWLKVRCVGTFSNRSGVGAKIYVKAEIGGQTTWQLRQISTGNGYGNGGNMVAHFGLGNATEVERLRIEWPSGISQRLTEVSSDQVLEVSEPKAFVSDVRIEDNGSPNVGVRVSGDTQVRLQASEDLRNWTTFQDLNVSQRGRLDVIDDQGNGRSKRYYRVKAE